MAMNYFGALINEASGNDLFMNDFTFSSYIGLYIQGSSSAGNSIVQNNFIGNPLQAMDDTLMPNTWDMNFWDDWGGVGPYLIPGPTGSMDMNPSAFAW
jgi:nitrous oxidase accessory protein NosD